MHVCACQVTCAYFAHEKEKETDRQRETVGETWNASET